MSLPFPSPVVYFVMKTENFTALVQSRNYLESTSATKAQTKKFQKKKKLKQIS